LNGRSVVLYQKVLKGFSHDFIASKDGKGLVLKSFTEAKPFRKARMKPF